MRLNRSLYNYMISFFLLLSYYSFFRIFTLGIFFNLEEEVFL